MIDWLRRKAQPEPTITLHGEPVPVVLRRLPQAKRLTLRLSPDGAEVRLTIPKWLPTAEALRFAHSRADWLAQQKARFAKPVEMGDGTALPFRGETVFITHRADAPRRIRLEGDRLIVGGPAEGLGPRVTRWLHAQAKECFAQDLAFYAARADLPTPPLALSNAKARWGSCSSTGAVRLNWRLIMAPDTVRRAVVAHEVTHLIHFDHSPAFHACLARLFEGDVAATNLWLKQNGRGLYSVLP
ncbi:M48 family peptidase [Novosphingobium umbonatum]|uniref:M48 family peptidase n=1 Tax=Novosphingobium umbonatum TaxID=1908524 RepID=A0A3S2V688_9SPHN|nr:SprT family zinc-dependent metalloprotease [Novosphingobium umbonatum]RVU04676.1 M48 family peptidase [Novosphingobium umbonatum]